MDSFPLYLLRFYKLVEISIVYGYMHTAHCTQMIIIERLNFIDDMYFSIPFRNGIQSHCSLLTTPQATLKALNFNDMSTTKPNIKMPIVVIETITN